jgi:hypothetical protein
MSSGAWDKGAWMVVGAGVDLVSIAAATFYSGNADAKFAKMFNFS